MSKIKTGAGAQKAYNRISDVSRLRYRTQRNLDADLDGRSYDDSVIAGGVTMPIKSGSPVGTNNHNNDQNSILRIDPSNNFPCYITPNDSTYDNQGKQVPVFDSEQQKVANDMLPFMNISSHTNVANVQSGLEVTMESYGPFSVNNLRVKTTYNQAMSPDTIGTEESTSEKFKKGDVKPVP